MIRYKNLGGSSGVYGYEIGYDSIHILFHDGAGYLYTEASAGGFHMAQMTQRAAAGIGLNSYINRHVKKLYAAKTR
jgi:hypothetical protein